MIYIYYRFIVRFPIGFDFLFITYFLHFFLSWASSLSISSSAISALHSITISLVVFQPVFCLHLILHTFLHPVLVTFPHHMSIPSQPNTFNDSCDRLNSNQLSHFFTCPSVFHGNITHPSIICCIFGFLKYTHSVCWWRLAISAGGLSSACQCQSNLPKLSRDKLLIKHTCTILTLGCGSLWHLGPGDQVPEIQQIISGVNQRKGHRMWPLTELYCWPLMCVGVEDLMGSGVPTI